MMMDETGNQYDISDYIQNLGWEENEKELSVRSSFCVRNDKTSKGKLSSLLRPGCLIAIFASDGKQKEEVARGYITTWNLQLQNNKEDLQCTNYDSLYFLQKSQENRYYASGTGTKSIVTELLKEYKIPMKGYHGPNVTHGKRKYNNSYVSDILLDILEDAQKKGSGTYLLRSTKGYADIVKRGSNTTVYVFQTKNIQSLHTNISIADLVTRVRVIGQKEDNGKSRIEATLNGLTKYGIRQKIYIRGSEESLKDAKSAAQEILDENGTIKEDITLQAPDVPWIRKGDLIYVIVGVTESYYYVKGIQHDCESYRMTMKLEAAKIQTISTENQTERKKEFKEGDIVNFYGGIHYVSSYPDAKGYPARAGKAKITKKREQGTHPWHLIHTDQHSNVYGWVDEGTFDR